MIPGMQGHYSPQFHRDRGLRGIGDVPKDRSAGARGIPRDRDMGTLKEPRDGGVGCWGCPQGLGVLRCH